MPGTLKCAMRFCNRNFTYISATDDIYLEYSKLRLKRFGSEKSVRFCFVGQVRLIKLVNRFYNPR
jgi:hypothetical protein